MRLRLFRFDTTEITAARIVLEIGVIVVGVMVALAANQWREARAESELAARLLATIRAEMATNQRELEGAINRREEQLRSIRDGGAGISLQACRGRGAIHDFE